jgi:hypothetical protein
MSSGPWTFRPRDIARALRAGKAAGVPVEIRFERLTGDLVIREARTDDSATDVADPVPPEDIVL